MPDDTSHSPDRPHVTAGDVYRLYRAWAGFGAEMVRRPVALAGTAGGRMADATVRGLLGPWNPSALAGALSREWLGLATGLAAVPAAAASAAADRLDATPDPGSDIVERALAGATPAPSVTRVDVDHGLANAQLRDLAARAGETDATRIPQVPEAGPGAPFLLPARVLDASQGWAAWFVPVAEAWRLMEEAVTLGHQPASVLDLFEPVSVRRGEAMVTLLASDYRASDFGVTQEIGLTLSVTPTGYGVTDPGQLFLRLVVTDPYSVAAARQIWGIRKDLWDNGVAGQPRMVSMPKNPAQVRPVPGHRLEAAYGPDLVRFGIGALRPRAVPGPGTLELAFPRIGGGRSDDLPGAIYSVVEPHGPPAAQGAAARSLLRRSGTGEGMQFGGPVGLTLPEDREAGRGAGCLCSRGMACLCDTLRGLRLHTRPPAANGWTDRMRCTLDEPVPLPAQRSGNSPE